MTREVHQMELMYCRNCGTVRVHGLKRVAKCGACKKNDWIDLEATTRGDGSVVFYFVCNKPQEGSK